MAHSHQTHKFVWHYRASSARFAKVLTVIIRNVDRPALSTTQLEDNWRTRFNAIRLRYEIDRRPQVKAEYLRLLKQFADLILRGKMPE